MEQKTKKFVKHPSYPGGAAALNKFVAENLKYPSEALQNNISGSVFLQYVVTDDGVVESAKVLHGLGFGCDEEAMRVVKLLRFGSVRNKGLRLKTTKKITIHFNLSSVQQTITYNYKSEEKKPAIEQPQPRVYNIKLVIK